MTTLKIGFCSLDWSNLPGKKSPFVPGEPTGGGAGWYRMVLPAQTLANHDIDAHYGPHLTGTGKEFALRKWDGTVVDDCDVIVIQRWMDERAPEMIRRARAEGQIVINDVDDWFEGIPPSNVAFLGHHPKYNPQSNRNHYHKSLASSSAITVSTPYLRDRYQKLLPGVPVFVIPNMLDVARWPVLDPGKRCKVGWVGATFNRSGDLQVLGGVLGDWLVEHNVPFFHGGANNAQTEGLTPLGLSEDVQYASLPMVSIEDYPRLFRKFTLGVVPLSMIPFNEAKSNIKGLEMSASGLPFVASPTPAYKELFDRGAGWLADRPRSWRTALNAMLDGDMRALYGKCGRKTVELHYDIEKNWQNWTRVYDEIDTQLS